MYYDKAVNNCPAGYLDEEQNNFVAYDGPPQSYKAPQNYPKVVKEEINKFIEQYDEEQTPLDTN